MSERPPRASGRAETIVANLPPGCACMVCPRAEASSIRPCPAGPSSGARQLPDPPKDPNPRETARAPPDGPGHPGISPSTYLIMTMSHLLSMPSPTACPADLGCAISLWLLPLMLILWVNPHVCAIGVYTVGESLRTLRAPLATWSGWLCQRHETETGGNGSRCRPTASRTSCALQTRAQPTCFPTRSATRADAHLPTGAGTRIPGP